MKTAIAILVAALALWGLDRLLLAAERRGWVYWRRRRARPGSVGNALLEVQALVEPRAKELAEAIVEERTEEDESGEPPRDRRAERS